MQKLIFRRKLVKITAAFIFSLLSLCKIAECQQVRPLSAGQLGITEITRGSVDLKTPRNVPLGQIWRYGMGVPFQIGPTTAAMFCNIGCNASHDFEMGTDVIIFNRLSEIDAKNAIPISRSHEEFNPRNGEQYTVAKYTMRGGFVPLGAKCANGSAHPHAGTGFGLCETVGFRKDLSTKPWKDKDSFSYSEFYQFTYDGKNFRVTHMEKLPGFSLIDGWRIKLPGMTNAIPSGDDLLFAMAGSKPGSGLWSGIARFRRLDGSWQPVSFVPVAESCSEPSLVLDFDNVFLFSARNQKYDILVWKSSDNAATWERVIHVADARSATPVVLGRSAGGIPYIIGNEQGTDRAVLKVWPLNMQRTGLENPIVVRDPLKEFGSTPSGDSWFVDIPSAGVVRLADGKWHGLLTHRLCTQKEVVGGGKSTPQTGCYVEEVIDKGMHLSEWNFN